MPKMTGMDLIIEIHSCGHELGFIIVSGDALIKDKLSAIGVLFVEKHVLEDAVRSVVKVCKLACK